MAHAHQHESIEQELECVSQVPIFQRLAADQLTSVAQMTRPVVAKKGGTVFSTGEVSQTLYIVNVGQVRLYHLAEDGREQVLRVLNPGDFIGEIALFTDEIHSSYAEATKDSELCTISRASLTALIKDMPQLSMALLGALADRLKTAERQATLLAIPDALPRLAGYLQEISGHQAGTIDLPMSKQDLAAYLGMTPESLSRKLRQLVKDGVIETIGRRQVKVLDSSALAAVAPE
ncbi:Crp/Fnr family transcriptional regulator [Levilactobacillus suantsaiihabitans]|uniref:Crp/Fnr family transcriptional regulator n=1 Tax=Levilactobacillus suantsaiihabitans TaxID=2487722 RepID=A0A4Z0JAH5_9LACO|nr:Crp/Fnr family transcriptional regulator [Levilactobacillus suantsaiihabitans]TGD18102.1 Crp/Fnr family transcriptional regulator [Levilactobacillus suantsaiihabitans]